jgi:hypothetical protein
LLASGCAKAGTSTIRDSRGSVSKGGSVVARINSLGCLLPDSAVHGQIDRPLPCTNDFLRPGFSEPEKTSKKLARPISVPRPYPKGPQFVEIGEAILDRFPS